VGHGAAPPPYAITDAVQAELSDRFGEALQISQWVQEIWREVAAEEQSDTRPPEF
jgi:hypothetical protein